MNFTDTPQTHVTRFAAEYRETSPCSFAPRVGDVVGTVAHHFGPGSRKDHEMAVRAYDRAVAAGEVEEVEGRVYVVAA